MSKAQAHNFDPSRLPAYRSSFLERFHPYGRAAASHHAQDRLMTTVDHRYRERPILEAQPDRPAEPCCQEIPDSDALPGEQNSPAVGVEDDEIPVGERLGHSKLAAAFSALLEALRVKYLTKEAVRDFLRPKEGSGSQKT
ncbi:hypothetical protein C8Q80DRAFT_1270601 [Daedaleopsis nitida]|nr:hypothetical protein C8Q80DRAFT_1270601 [Daedaleopsis nitida]